MSDRPGAPELLEVARETLKQVVDEVPAHRRHAVLMVLNAMAIAARDANDCSDAGIDRQLREICPGGHDLASRRALYERVARNIRAGMFDQDAGLHRWLLADVRRRLDLSNPRYLRMADDAARTRKPPSGSPGGGLA